MSIEEKKLHIPSKNFLKKFLTDLFEEIINQGFYIKLGDFEHHTPSPKNIDIEIEPYRDTDRWYIVLSWNYLSGFEYLFIEDLRQNYEFRFVINIKDCDEIQDEWINHIYTLISSCECYLRLECDDFNVWHIRSWDDIPLLLEYDEEIRCRKKLKQQLPWIGSLPREELRDEIDPEYFKQQNIEYYREFKRRIPEMSIIYLNEGDTSVITYPKKLTDFPFDVFCEGLHHEDVYLIEQSKCIFYKPSLSVYHFLSDVSGDESWVNIITKIRVAFSLVCV